AFAAPTLAELLAALPAKIERDGETYWLEMDRAYWDAEAETYAPRVFYANLDRETLPLNGQGRAIEWSGSAADVLGRIYLALSAADLLRPGEPAPSPSV